MWLINVATGDLTEFDNEDPPAYAILSHRWGAKEHEQTFKEYRKGLKQATNGHHKILKLREIAFADGYEWVWIDSACIDKRSSAELSEAINSMFIWYRNAAKCYALLGDVDDASDDGWKSSEWWTRGWTLQELLAPAEVTFLNAHWAEIGTKTRYARAIWIITGIPESVLLGRVSYLHWTVAQKLSWAAGRRTKRVEDRAYSLLGLFHINMPLLYGEGEKAFRRLQIEILQKYSDESIFAWKPPPDLINVPHEVFALSPDDFAGCSDMEPNLLRAQSQTEHRIVDPPRPTSWGIEFRSHAHRLEPLTGTDIVINGRRHDFLYAVTLTSAWAGKVRELPCVMILVQSGPAVLTYKRLACMRLDTEYALRELRNEFVVGERLMDLRFYLRYDTDFG